MNCFKCKCYPPDVFQLSRSGISHYCLAFHRFSVQIGIKNLPRNRPKVGRQDFIVLGTKYQVRISFRTRILLHTWYFVLRTWFSPPLLSYLVIRTSQRCYPNITESNGIALILKFDRQGTRMRLMVHTSKGHLRRYGSIKRRCFWRYR